MATASTTIINTQHAPPRQSRFSNVKFWLIAILMHLLVFVILAQIYVLVIQPSKDELVGENFDGVSVVPPTAPPVPLEAQQQVEMPAQPSNPNDFQPILTSFEPSLRMPVAILAQPVMTKHALPAPSSAIIPMQWGKRTGDKRKLVPDPAIEDAVLKALRWLARNQNEDGSWGHTYPVGMTGLALLAFLAHGDTYASREFGNTVLRGVNYLLIRAERGRMGGRVDYEHGIATYALAEAYGMTKDQRLREPLEKCLQTIIDGQTKPGGGWIYGFRTEDNFGDMSISGWQIQALKAAHLAGLMREPIEKTLDKAMDYAKAVYNPRTRGFGYRSANAAHTTLPSAGPSIWSLTGTGVMCLQFWKNGSSPEAIEAVTHLSDNLRFSDPHESFKLYGYYYATQALFLADGPHGKMWLGWDREYRKPLIATQNPDGSFPPCGSGGEMDKFVYSTALSTLMLEVWYRNDPASLTVLKGAQR